jgi:hypothetical protein
MSKEFIKPTLKHQNNGRCEKCMQIMNKYAGFNPQLKGWFILFQAKHHEAHISCAGRGFEAQEAAKLNKKSRAKYGESAHNYNCAIDIFVQLPGKDLYDKEWFEEILAPEVPYFLKW